MALLRIQAAFPNHHLLIEVGLGLEAITLPLPITLSYSNFFIDEEGGTYSFLFYF